ncbi:MAG: glycosyltransferase family 4 protein [Candidatus Celaenobacter antarcticus]|nr:glycosyltransferase family 4 protein [Candidatus Celaenobacter antarcticus]
MKIGMILDKSFPTDMRVENEATALIQNDYEVFLLCLDYDNSLPKKEIYKGIHLNRIYKKKKLANRGRGLINTPFNYYTYFWAKQIVKFAKENCIQILHIHDLYMLGAGFIANDRLDKKIIIVGDLHENYADALEHYRFSTVFPGNILISIKKWRKIEKEWISKLDYAVVVVEEMKQRITPFIKKDKIIVYENYVNKDDFLNYSEHKEIIEKYKNKFVISYIGGFDYHRGIHTIIKSLQYLKNIDNLKFCAVGSGKNLNELFTYAKKLNVLNLIDFEGWQSPNNLPNYFFASDIGIIPHLKSVQTDNSSPNKLYQYMLSERPIISTNCNSIQRVIKDSNTGLIYKSGDAKNLAKKIIQLYENPELRKQMGKNGKKAVLEKYNWSNTSENLIKLYKTIENSIKQR